LDIELGNVAPLYLLLPVRKVFFPVLHISFKISFLKPPFLLNWNKDQSLVGLSLPDNVTLSFVWKTGRVCKAAYRTFFFPLLFDLDVSTIPPEFSASMDVAPHPSLS